MFSRGGPRLYLHFCLTSWSRPPPTTFRTGTVNLLAMLSLRFFPSPTVGTVVVALAEETKAVATGAAADRVLQNTGENALVDGGDVVSIGGLVAAGDLGIVAALGLSLVQGHIVTNGELDVASTGGAFTGGKGPSQWRPGQEQTRRTSIRWMGLMRKRLE